MAGKKVVWLGDNVTKTLIDPATGKGITVGEAITLDAAQIKALKAANHRFADPKSDEAQSAAQPPAVTPK